MLEIYMIIIFKTLDTYLQEFFILCYNLKTNNHRHFFYINLTQRNDIIKVCKLILR